MSKDLFFKAVGGVNPQLLDDFERREAQTVKKKKSWVVAAACCVLLLGAGVGTGTIFVENFLYGGYLFYHNDSVSGGGFTHMISQVFHEDEEKLFYTYVEHHVDISDYCSESDYFIDLNLDAQGTGTALVIGGDKGERGYHIYHYEQGLHIWTQAEMLNKEPDSIWLSTSDIEIRYGDDREMSASFPLVIWSRHSSQFLGYELSALWTGLPDMVALPQGTATKVGDSFYAVKGEDVEKPFTFSEEKKLFTNALHENNISFAGVSHDIEIIDGAEVFVHVLRYTSDWTERDQAKAEQVLDNFGFYYVLELVE